MTKKVLDLAVGMPNNELHRSTTRSTKPAGERVVSENLKSFLSAYLEWVDAGAPNTAPFKRRYGLCSNLDDWSRHLDSEERTALGKELDTMFKTDGLDMCHPFGVDEYFEARERETQHLNQARIAWVRSKVAQFAEA
jgi:hypothetical protein